ncbi:hypothetical protein LA52FAK_08790 [Desulforhopalus sp. 52FAK]
MIVDGFAAGLDHFKQLHGSTVLLKPNLISSRGSALSCSHPQFIEGVALWFKEQGARVKVGDSPAFGTARSVCQARKITGPLEKIGVDIVNFKRPIEKKLSCNRSVTIAAESLECDYFVGLPRIKAHNQMYVTLAVKNIFGIVKGVNKALLHMSCDNSHQNFSEIILGLVELLPRQFHLIDGIEVMSGSGPLDGYPLAVGCVGGAASPVALDTAIADLLQLDPRNIPLNRVAKEMGLTGSEMSTIDFPLSLTSDFRGAGFVPPAGLNPVRFNPFRFISGMCKRLGLKLRS